MIGMTRGARAVVVVGGMTTIEEGSGANGKYGWFVANNGLTKTNALGLRL